MQDNSFQDFIDEIKQKNDLVSVASKYVQLERRGRYYWCRCPFHGEKTPSLCINDIDNFFYCFGCHVGGNVITFVKQIESLDFMESVKLLASWANIEIPSTFGRGGNSEDVAKAKERKDRLISLMKDTAVHYHDNLKKNSAEPALTYMKKRQLTDQLATRFGLGFSDGYNELIDFLTKKGYTREEMLASGAVKEKNNKIFDPLAGRLIFPIINIYGEVIAFGGRSLDPHPDFAKYLNTAETEIFNKRNTLYAINYLKKQRQSGPIPYVIVVEGYMDTISLHKAGFTMTVASMGTALTNNQAKLIKRFADKVYICYDGDSAGQSATLRGLDILREHGLDVMVVQLPDKFDPDDVIKTYGREGYQKILDEALPLIEFKLKYLTGKYDLTSTDERVKYINDAIDVLALLADPVERELYTKRVCEISSTNIDFIKRSLERKLHGENENQKQPIATNATKTELVQETENEKQKSAIIKAEKYVLCALIHQKPYAHFATNVEYLFSGERKDVYNAINSAIIVSLGQNIIQKLYDMYEGENQQTIVEIINFGAKSADDEQNESKYYSDCVLKLYKNFLSQELSRLNKAYSEEVNNDERKKISMQIQEVMLKIKNGKVDKL